jgi:hypothetical protein
LTSRTGRNTPALNEEYAGWVPQLNWTFWTRHKSLAPAAIPTSDLLAHRLQGIPNTLCRLNNTFFQNILHAYQLHSHHIQSYHTSLYLFTPSLPLAPSLKLVKCTSFTTTTVNALISTNTFVTVSQQLLSYVLLWSPNLQPSYLPTYTHTVGIP